MPDPASQAEHCVGVDMGGTKIYAGVFTPSFECLGTARVSTKPERGVEAVIARIARCVQEAADESGVRMSRIKGVGIGAPGAVDPETGNVIFAPNLEWKDVPLKKELEKLLGVPVFAENDCNLCALGVYEKELRSKPRHMVGIFLGTGIGAGIVINGAMYSGFNRTAGEIGHMVMQVDGPKCGCGQRGCFEALASRTAIFRRIKQAVKDGQQTVLAEKLGPDLEDMRSGDLRKAIHRGDKFVARVIDEAAFYTGIAVGNVINLLNPEVIVLGGGLIEQLAGEMMPIIEKTARDHVLPGTARGIQIIASALADDAGITGGAVLAQHHTQ